MDPGLARDPACAPRECDGLEPVRGSAGSSLRPGAIREVALLVVLYAGYTFSRVLASDGQGSAVRRATGIHRWEHACHLDVEGWTNGLITRDIPLEVVFSYWYSTAHYLLTPLTLIWLWRRRPGHYRLLRNT